MIGQVLTYGVNLTGNMSAKSRADAQSLKALQGQLRGAKLTLAEYQEQMNRAKASGDAGAYTKYAGLVGDAKRQVFDLNHAIEGSRDAMNAGSASAGGLGSALGIVTAAAAAEAAALYGVVKVIDSLIGKALEVTSVNRRLAATFEALGQQGPGSGKKTLAFLDDLSARLPQSREQLATWTKEIESLGVTDLGQIRHEVLALSSAQAIMGDEGAASYQKIAERVRIAVEEHKGLKLADKQLKALYATGLNITEVASAMGLSTQELGAQLKAGTVDAQRFGNTLSDTLIRKGKGPLEAMSMDIGTLKQKAGEAFGHLFDDVDATPLLRPLQDGIALLGQGTVSGKTMKGAITDALNAIIRGLGRAMTVTEIYFGRLEIWSLQAGVTLEKVEHAVLRIGSAFAGIGKALGAAGLAAIPGVGGLAAGVAAAGAGRSFGNAVAPGNAGGGLVSRPAPGEYMASVQPGEMILPRRLTRELQAGNDNGGGPTVNHYHFDNLQLTVQGEKGVTDATKLSATGLSTMLERLQLAGGR